MVDYATPRSRFGRKSLSVRAVGGSATQLRPRALTRYVPRLSVLGADLVVLGRVRDAWAGGGPIIAVEHGCSRTTRVTTGDGATARTRFEHSRVTDCYWMSDSVRLHLDDGRMLRVPVGYDAQLQDATVAEPSPLRAPGLGAGSRRRVAHPRAARGARHRRRSRSRRNAPR